MRDGCPRSEWGDQAWGASSSTEPRAREPGNCSSLARLPESGYGCPVDPRFLVSLVLGALLSGCSGPPGVGRQLGDDLGGFHVAATELTNGCGAGALGSRRSFDFEIELSRERTQLFWGRA